VDEELCGELSVALGEGAAAVAGASGAGGAAAVAALSRGWHSCFLSLTRDALRVWPDEAT
jgi:hypothetical protein